MNKICQTALCLVVVFAAPWSQAATVKYQASNIAGNLWQYDYSVTNDSLASSIEEFTIFFDLGLYSNLSISASPANWDSLVVQPDPGVPDNGFFDSLALLGGIANGATVNGFAVQFFWLGSGTPGSQSFAIIDPQTFATIQSGTTSPVPLPGALWLMASAIAAFGLRRAPAIKQA